MRRRSRSAGGSQCGDASGGGGSPSPIHSGPGQSREFSFNSKFISQDPLRHGSPIEEPFTTFDISRANQDWHKWQRIDTFQTPTSCCGPVPTDMEELAPRKGICPLRTDLLAAFRDEILEGCRADLHSVVTLVRQEVDRSIRQIICQVKRCVRDQNADSLNLLAELGRVRSTECDLTEVLREVQEARHGESSELLQSLQAARAGVEATSEGVTSMKTTVNSLVVRQGNVEDGISEVSADMQRVKAEVAEIRKVRTEMEFRNVREKKIEAEVADILKEVKELKTSLEASGVLDFRERFGTIAENLQGMGQQRNATEPRGEAAAAARARELESQLGRALSSGDHLAALRSEVQEALRRVALEVDTRGGAAVAGAMEAVASTFQAQLAEMLCEVRRVKADVDLKIIREGATRDIKIFVSSGGPREEDPDNTQCGVGLGGASTQAAFGAGHARGPGQMSGSLASASTSGGLAAGPGQDLSTSNWTEPYAPAEPRGDEDGRRPSRRAAAGGGSRASSRASEGGLPEEDLAALRCVFARADVNGSGSISMIETIKALRTDDRFARALGFDGCVRVRQEDGTRDAFVRAFQRADTDSSTTISWEELIAFALRQRQDRSAPVTQEESEMSVSHEEEYHGSIVDGYALDRALSRARRANAGAVERRGSGESDRWERGAMLGAEEKAALRAMFDRVDANGSGKVSMAETIKALAVDESFARVLGFDGPFRVRQEDGTRESFCRAFQQVDADGDRNISWEELLVFASGQRDANLARGAAPTDGVGALEDLRR